MPQLLLRLFKASALLPIAMVALLSAAHPAQAKTPHSVFLHWDASKSAVVGHNVYRTAKSGGPYTKLTRAPVPTVQYTDTSVKAGQTYFYAVSSVDSRKVEGPKSEEVQTTVPTP